MRTVIRFFNHIAPVALAFAVCISASVAQSDLKRRLEAEQAALDSLEAELAAGRKALKKTSRAKVSVADEIGAIEKRIASTRGELKRLRTRENQLSSRLDRTSHDVTRAERSLAARERGTAARIRETYKRSRQNPLGRNGRVDAASSVAILFSSGSFIEGVRQLLYLEKAAVQDQVDLEALRADRLRLHEVLQLRRAQLAHQASLLKAKRSVEQTLSGDAKEKSKQLKWLVQQEDVYRDEIQQSETHKVEVTARIGEIIKEIERRQRAGLRLAELPPFDFDGKRGELRRPTEGRIVSRFGRHQDPELKTWTFNRGIDIDAPEGTDVQAVAPGEVVLVDWLRGYGQLVLLRHPGGYFTLYGHLATRNVRAEEILDEGAILGTVGSTGRLDGKARLHFELMKGEEALDPVGWLKVH